MHKTVSNSYIVKKKKKSRFLAQSKATYTALEVHKITLMTVMSLNA